MGIRILHYSDLEGVFDDPDRAGRVAGLLRERSGSDAIIAGSGDDTAPGVLSLAEEGRQVLPFFERVGAHVDAIGNHDLDYGPDALASLVADAPQTWLNANLYRDESLFAADAGATPLTVVETASGRVGVTGVTTRTLPDITPPASELRVTDPIPAAREAVSELRDRDLDAVVALAHLHDDEAIARQLDVDAVLSGHVHDARTTIVDGVPVSRSGAGGRYVHEITLGDDPAVSQHDVADAPIDDWTARRLRERVSEAGLDEVVATVEDPIERTQEAAMGGESRIGNFVADAYRRRTNADVGLQNGAGIRAGPPLHGRVTVGDLIGLVPFEEATAVAEVTGDELRAILREADGQVGKIGDDDEWNVHVSGVEAAWDRSTLEFESVTVGGEPLDPDAIYEVATSAYLLGTDHEFPTLTEDHRVATLDTQYEVIVDHAREHGIDPEIEGRVVFA